MGIWKSICNWFDVFADVAWPCNAIEGTSFCDEPGINPASGLPMIENSCIDVGGSPLGTDIHDNFGSSFDSGFDFGSNWDSLGGSDIGGGIGNSWDD